MKLELLDLKWAISEKFKDYLAGSQFTVIIDKNPLTYLHKAKLGAIEQQWVANLTRFDFKLEYKPGKTNGNVDELSRKLHVQEEESSDSSEQIEPFC